VCDLYYVQRVASILSCVILALAGVWSVLLARANGQMPNNTEYLSLTALQMEYEGSDSTAILQRIAQLNPTASAPRIRLGLAAEQKGDLPAAERWLRAAYDVDHQFEPRWTLANFYLRQNRPEDFWTWIRSALEMSYGDRTPAFDLCWRMSNDARTIQNAIPPHAAAPYLAYVLSRHPEAVAGAALRVNDTGLLLAATDTLLEGARYSEAVAVWKHAGRTGPRSIAESSSGHGFDWRETKVEGVTHSTLDAARGHRIRFSGRQAEAAEILRQFAGGLNPGARYRIAVKSSGDSIPGLEWRMNGVRTQDFRATDSVVLVSLWYQRPLGEVRAEGSIDLTDVALLPLQ
jgi:tetratricopeptide (TPR) repeat protein